MGVRLHNKGRIVMSQKTVQLPKEIEKEVTLLRGFRDLVGKRTGYMFGAKVLGKTMSEDTAEVRQASTQAGKAVRKAVKKLIKTPTKENSQKVTDAQETLTEAQEKNKTARKPHMKKIAPLRKIVRYIDTVAVPDSLKELGRTVTPLESLSEWAKKAIA